MNSELAQEWVCGRGSVRYCDRNKRGRVCLMPEKSYGSKKSKQGLRLKEETEMSVMIGGQSIEGNEEEEKPNRMLNVAHLGSMKSGAVRRDWGRLEVRWMRAKGGQAHSGEVKAGRSGPRVEWSSPGRRQAFLGVHGQLEPLGMERRRNVSTMMSSHSVWSPTFSWGIYTVYIDIRPGFIATFVGLYLSAKKNMSLKWNLTDG